MAGRQTAQRRESVVDDIGDWMVRRTADAQRFTRDAEAMAHEAWRRAARTGEEISAARPSDVLALGARLLGQPVTASGAPAAKAANPAARQPPVGVRARDRLVREAGGLAAQTGGNVVGALRGARNTAYDLGSTVAFVSRLANPYEAATAPLGTTAWDELFDTASQLGRAARDRVSHPESLKTEVVGAAREFRASVDPTATPEADTLRGEFNRRFEIGKNQGELGFNAGSMLYGAGELKALSGLNFLSEEARTASALKRATELADGDPLLAQRFMEPYKGMGHHVIGRNQPMPAFLGGGLYPRAIVESPFFVIDGKGMRTGEFRALHFGVDDDYYGGKIPARYGGGGWSGRKLGWQRYDPLQRAWQGTTKPMKLAVGAGALGAGGLVYDAFEGEDGR